MHARLRWHTHVPASVWPSEQSAFVRLQGTLANTMAGAQFRDWRACLPACGAAYACARGFRACGSCVWPEPLVLAVVFGHKRVGLARLSREFPQRVSKLRCTPTLPRSAMWAAWGYWHSHTVRSKSCADSDGGEAKLLLSGLVQAGHAGAITL